MYDPPGYLWAITIAGTAAIAAASCVVLYSGAAVVLGSWFTASAVIAGHGGYHARLGHGVPWMPVAVASFFGTLLALGRIPVVARALTAPGMTARLELPHTFRVVEGTAFLLLMFLGHLPRCSPCPRAWATSLPASPRRWSRTGSRGAPAAAAPCGTTRSAWPIW